MSLTDKAKNKVKGKTKKIAFKVLKPFLPFILIIILILFAFCTIIDTVLLQGVQADSSSMSKAELEIKNKCIEKAKLLNTCHNFIDTESTNSLLDVDNLEENKQIEWSHLYVLMKIQCLDQNCDFNEALLEEISNNFVSTFKYTKNTIITETKNTNDKGEVSWNKTSEKVEYILIESDTIYGHYIYNYEDKTTLSNDENTRTTKKVYKSEELKGDEYSRLKVYLKKYCNILDEDIDNTVAMIITSASGYYDDSDINNSNDILIGNGMFTWPIPGYTKITSEFGYRTDPITRKIFFARWYRCICSNSVAILLLWQMV